MTHNYEHEIASLDADLRAVIEPHAWLLDAGTGRMTLREETMARDLLAALVTVQQQRALIRELRGENADLEEDCSRLADDCHWLEGELGG